MGYQPKRLFTLDEANRMLPLVGRIAADIRATYARLADRSPWAAPNDSHLLDTPRRDELRDVYAEVERDRKLLLEFVGELDRLGVELKGAEEGLVDFPSLRGGRVVYLCWKLGEADIGFWHELEAGFHGRQPLETTAPATVGAEPGA